MIFKDIDFPSWKFESGQKVKLCNMVEAPQRNGETVTIFGFRPVVANEYCSSGRAYYILEDGPGHYIYEERLRPIDL